MKFKYKFSQDWRTINNKSDIAMKTTTLYEQKRLEMNEACLFKLFSDLISSLLAFTAICKQAEVSAESWQSN